MSKERHDVSRDDLQVDGPVRGSDERGESIDDTEDLTPARRPSQAPSPSARSVRVADRYELGDQLGAGGMGEVFQARDRELDRQVAIKFMNGLDDRRLARFRDEARALARVEDASTVTIYDVGVVDDRPYLVYEYVPGHSLASERTPIHWRAALRFGVGIARGLAAIHRHGVLHCDLKPANAIVASDGRIKLIDFGLAVLLAEPQDSADGHVAARQQSTHDASQPSVPAGTPGYIAPERWHGHPPTPQSDVYALGALLHKLCTGKVPPLTTDFSEARASARDTPWLAHLASIDAGFAAVIDRCLQPAAEDRFDSGAAVCEALQAVEAHLNASRPPENPYRGLTAFESDSRHLFFGRDGDIRGVLAELRRQSFVLLVGDSGVGKSSLARAGILPRVRDGALMSGRLYRVPIMTPGLRPLDKLADILSRDLNMAIDSVADELTSGSFAALAQRIARRHDQHVGTLLFVDQLEELATVSEPEQATAMGGFLSYMARANVAGWHALGALRADHLTRLASRSGLTRLVTETRPSYVFPLDRTAVRDAVVVPAAQLDVRFESEALIEELVGAGAEHGGLPLLQFVLAEMWANRDQQQGLMTEVSLRAMGGVGGALARHADSVLARLDADTNRAARAIVLALLTPQRTRRRRRRDELGPAGGRTQRALQALVEGRLVVAHSDGGEPGYELAHEALVGQWPRLRRWLERTRDSAAVRESLANAAGSWQRLGRPRAALWQRVQLAEVDELLARSGMSATQTAFLHASKRALRKQRVARGLAIAAAIVTLATLLIYAVDRRRQRASAEAEAQRIWESARKSFEQGQSAEALLKRERAAIAELVHKNSYDPDELDARWRMALTRSTEIDRQYFAASRDLAALRARAPRRVEVNELLKKVIEARVQLAATSSDGPLLEELLQQWRALGWADRPYFNQLPIRVGIGQSPADALQRQAERGRLDGSGDWIDIPPGQVLYGFGTNAYDEGLRSMYETVPLHVRDVDAFAIARREMTFADWLRYLEANAPDTCPKQTLMASTHADIKVSLTCLGYTPEQGHRWALTWTEGTYSQTVSPGQSLRFPPDKDERTVDWLKMPAVGISADQAVAYASWLADNGVSGARLCTEVEWERAARGADGRAYPHGDELATDEANIDARYGRKAGYYGPDEGCAHSQLHSPFGVCDMAGNVWEYTRAVVEGNAASTEYILRGGSYYQPDSDAHAANRWPVQNTRAPPTVGVRLCADAIP